jgi:putative cell wall-binding protein
MKRKQMKRKSLKAVALASALLCGALVLGVTSVVMGSTQVEAAVSSPTYPIVDTGQTLFYSASAEISAPAAGEAFYGQDAQFAGNQPSYTLSADGLTVQDNVTGLMWQQTTDTNGDGVINYADEMTWNEAMAYPATLNAEKYAGYSDWRLPTIKEAYSLILFVGTDPNPMGTDTSGLVPFIDTRSFAFAYGDTSAGERIIDTQYASTTKYVSTTMNGAETMFGVNFADGRIKGYGLKMGDGSVKRFSVQCVRGNPAYGINDFADNGDGTITDKATGLMWAQADSGKALDWQEALAWAQAMNSENYLGHNDWRVPNVKELQSIIDYTRSPDTTQSAAIDPLFSCTQITNEAGQLDYPCFWTSTTHLSDGGGADKADYMAFGRAMGFMNSVWMDVHGAGAQRSDPKMGDPAQFPHGRGPQGDAIRIYNYVRLVRDAGGTSTTGTTTYSSYRGTDRYDTALKLSQAAFPAALPADSGVVLAPGRTFPEALCGAPLASAYGGPVLLTGTTALYSTVKNELVRLNPKYVFCIGLSSTVAHLVKAALPSATVTSVNGAGTGTNIIYDMSRKVANALAARVGTAGKMTTATAIITPGDKFPDAIGVSPLACAKKWPIILTPASGTIHTSAASAISDLGITQAIKVGTYVALPAGVTGLDNLSGADRYATNAKVAVWARDNAGLTFIHIGIATGDKFPDALASGPYLAKDNGILPLSPLAGSLPTTIAALITANQAAVQHVTFIAMVEPVVGQVKALLP